MSTSASDRFSIIQDLSIILAKNMSEKVRIEFESMIFNYAINNLHVVPGIKYNDLAQSDPKNLSGIIHEIAMRTTCPFLQYQTEKLGKLETSEVDYHWAQFYSGLLWQLYEQRNFITHQGIYCATTVDRLQFFFRGVVVRWRTILFNALEQGQFSSPKEVIKYLLETVQNSVSGENLRNLHQIHT